MSDPLSTSANTATSATTPAAAAPEKRQTGARLLALDALRGLAALYVVAYHYTYRFEELYKHPGPLPFLIPSGELAVYLFFIISGFVIYMTLEKTRKWQDFVVSRVSRIYPAYWVAILLTFTLTNLVGLPGRTFGVEVALKNITMIHGLFGVPHIDGAYWSLEIEICFYFCMLMLFISGALKYPRATMLVWMLLSLPGPALLSPLPPAIGVFIRKVFLLRYIAWFCAGIVFYRWWKAGKFPRGDWFVFALLPLCVLTNETYNKKPALVCSVLFCLLFVWVVTGKAKILETRPLTFLGGISYSLYLVHQNVGFVIMRELKPLQQHPIVGIIAAVAISFALAWALNRFIEKPAMEFIRARYKPAKA